MPQALGQRVIGRDKDRHGPAAEQHQGIAGAAAESRGKQTLAGAGQHRRTDPARCRWQAANQPEQRAAGREMRIGQRRQPLLAQSQVGAQRRQQDGQQQPGEKWNQEELMPHRRAPV